VARVTLVGLHKTFGHVVAVRGLDLVIEDREFVSLLGPSGCGKTTTLRLIAGLETPTQGDVYFDGVAVTHLPANYRDIAMVFQSYALYPHMTVRENIGFPLKMMRVPMEDIRRRVEHVAGMLGITALLLRKPRELSGGQRQRVALGRAIVREPAVYLLDEPLSNLDAQLRVQMRTELKKLHWDLQRTFVYVTHDQTEALTMSDRIAVMHEGQLLQYGTPHEIYNEPRSRTVAAFVGSPPMNFLEGEVRSVGTTLTFEADAICLPLPAAWGARLQTRTRRVTLGIRPEAIELLSPTGDSSGLECTVYVQEPTGADLLVTLSLGGGLIRARTTPDVVLERGTKVRILPHPTKMRLFDGESGEALL
jgi:multiple sugar transport system ATP-binding protein